MSVRSMSFLAPVTPVDDEGYLVFPCVNRGVFDKCPKMAGLSF